MVRIIPITREYFAENRIQGFLDASTFSQLPVLLRPMLDYRDLIRRFDMPTTEVKFYHRHKSLDGILNLGHWKESFWMRHETENFRYLSDLRDGEGIILRNSFQHGSRLEYEGW